MTAFRLPAAVLAAAAALALAACGGVDAEDVDNDVSEQIEAAYGSAPEDLDCPDLEGEEGEEITCTATVDGAEVEANVTVVTVNDDEVQYSIEVTPPETEEESSEEAPEDEESLEEEAPEE